jgi:hypothetical protein
MAQKEILHIPKKVGGGPEFLVGPQPSWLPRSLQESYCSNTNKDAAARLFSLGSMYGWHTVRTRGPQGGTHGTGRD